MLCFDLVIFCLVFSQDFVLSQFPRISVASLLNSTSGSPTSAGGGPGGGGGPDLNTSILQGSASTDENRTSRNAPPVTDTGPPILSTQDKIDLVSKIYDRDSTLNSFTAQERRNLRQILLERGYDTRFSGV